MRKLILILLCATLFTGLNAQTMKTIKLNKPSSEIKCDVMRAFHERQSKREYADKDLSLQELSDLLWSANGFNRPGMRTAATAMNLQEIDVFVCKADGGYLYDAKAHELQQITTEDLRPAVANGQDFAKEAPICLVIVADLERFGGNDTNSIRATAYDAGIVSQNIYIYCSGAGLATVTRMTMDSKKLSKGLKLKESQFIHLNNPVGHSK